jgi:hypothetical protein
MNNRLTLGIVAFASCYLSATLALAQDQSKTEVCPNHFHRLPIYPEAKLCQMFDNTFPATLTYHASTDISNAAAFYLKELGKASKDVQVKGRRILHFTGDNHIIIISADGQGSQVDILMKDAF